MHLLEGFIALHAATGAERWLDRAEEIFRLCQLSFIDPASGALREYFDASLQPQVGVEGLIVEPGHCFEWSWLMELLARTGLEAALSLSDRLVGFARCHGLDAFRDVAINEVLIDGGQRDGFARLWPQTERLKAAAARFCRTNDPVESLEAQKAFASLTRYFDVPKAGLWRDKLLLDGSWIDEPAPGSSLYHITCAIAEVVDAVQIKPRRLSG